MQAAPSFSFIAAQAYKAGANLPCTGFSVAKFVRFGKMVI
jgi:hypothetical protein